MLLSDTQDSPPRRVTRSQTSVSGAEAGTPWSRAPFSTSTPAMLPPTFRISPQSHQMNGKGPGPKLLDPLVPVPFPTDLCGHEREASYAGIEGRGLATGMHLRARVSDSPRLPAPGSTEPRRILQPALPLQTSSLKRTV